MDRIARASMSARDVIHDEDVASRFRVGTKLHTQGCTGRRAY